MNAWEKVKQDLATAGYSESQKKNFEIRLQNVKAIKISDGMVNTTYRFILNYDVFEKDVFGEVAALFYTFKSLGYCDDGPFVNNIDTEPGYIRIFAWGEFTDERSV
jgi:hypothetical protein